MASYFSLSVQVWLCATFASAAILYTAAALWAAGGKGPACARSAPLILLLAALVPIGAYELLVLFASQAATIIAGVTLAGLVRRRRARVVAIAAGETLVAPARRTLRFSLGDLLGWLAVAAAVLAILRHAATGPAWSVQTVGGGAAIPALVGIGIALGAFAVAVIGVNRACGRRWEKFAGREDRGPSSWPKHIGRAAAIALAVLMFGMLADMYYALLPPPVPPAAILPNPNGFDRLTKLGQSFNWSAIPTQDVEAASEAACQQFVQDNSAAFAQLREDLQVPSQVPLAYDANFMAAYLPALQSHRTLARANFARTRALRSQGEFAQATESSLDTMRMAYATARGGLGVHESVATALVDHGREQLIQDLPKLAAAELARFESELVAVRDSREPLEEIFERERVWGRLSYGWMGRLVAWGEQQTYAENPTLRSVEHFHRRTDARLQLLIAEAAVRRYRLTMGNLPDDLAMLVPEYLTEVPADPFSEGPLVYRRMGDEYLLYSVWINGRDDGGVRPETAPADGSSDYYFDSTVN
jgi:hypothetical protein